MINIQSSNKITKIYLITNCYGDPNKIYIGKTINCRKSKHKQKFGNQITYDYIDQINSLEFKDWILLEKYWIEQFKQWGFDLQNINNGGGGRDFNSYELRIKISKPVIQYDLNNNFIKRWNSARDASNSLGVNFHSISACCNKKKIKIAGNFIWRFENDLLHKNYKTPDNLTSSKKIIQLDVNGNFIKEWPSMSEAGRTLNIPPQDISNCCHGRVKTCRKFIWKLKHKYLTSNIITEAEIP